MGKQNVMKPERTRKICVRVRNDLASKIAYIKASQGGLCGFVERCIEGIKLPPEIQWALDKMVKENNG